jgi:hypothetical protein
MRDRESARGEFGEQRLDVAKRGLAGRRIADMADRGSSGEASDDVVAVEIASDMALSAVAVEHAPVPAGDSRGFLAAMLKRMEAERDDRRRRIGTPDAEHAAFLAQLVSRKLWIERIGCQHGSARPLARTRAYRQPARLCRPNVTNDFERVEAFAYTALPQPRRPVILRRT